MNIRQRALAPRLVALFAALCLLRGWGDATVREVPTSYATIQDAINASASGDTVRVYSGVYTGPIQVNKSLVLIGSRDSTATVIVAPADFDTNTSYNHTLPHLTAERAIVFIGNSPSINVLITGFTVDGMRLGPAVGQKVAYAGILVDQCTATVTGDTVRNMLPADSAGSTWDDNRVYNGRGIDVRGNGAVATISNNYLEQINHFNIFINATDDNINPPAVSPTATVTGNTIVGKGAYNGGQKGIWFNAGAWGTASGNTITNFDFPKAAIEPERASCIVQRFGEVDTKHGVTITNNRIIAPSSINNKGIYIQGSNDVVTDNYIQGFRWNIESHDGVSALIARDSIIGGEIGVHVTSEKTPPYADSVTIGGSPANMNVIHGQDPSSIGGHTIDLTFRDTMDTGDYRSSIPVNATYNDFGVYTYGAVRARLFERGDTTLSPVNIDTILTTPFYCPNLHTAVTAFLQGPYDAVGDTMRSTLNQKGYLASHFSGSAVPALAVDSITIELRNAQSAGGSTYRAFAQAWLLTKGGILGFSDTTKKYVEFTSTWSGPYYTVIYHRNHLAIMDSTAQLIDDTTAPAVYDFSTAQNKAFGINPMKAVGTRFALFAADGNANGAINAVDRNLVWRVQNGSLGYFTGDFNLDGVVNAVDQNLFWRPNNGILGQIP